MEVRRVGFDEPDAVALVAAQRAELAERYGDPVRTIGRPLDPAAFAPPLGTFVVVRLDGRAVGCGGVRRLAGEVGDVDVGEIKRMFTAADVRGRGVARTVLAALEDDAAALGYRRLWLETGSLQHEAIALYGSAGYIRIPNYGHYVDDPTSRCFEKVLGARSADGALLG